jgi:hypothetical protein
MLKQVQHDVVGLDNVLSRGIDCFAGVSYSCYWSFMVCNDGMEDLWILLIQQIL